MTGWYCTGRGTHEYAIPDGIGFVVSPPPGSGHGGTMPVRLRCPECGLRKKLGYRVRRQIEESGLAEVDISALPF